MKLAQALVIRSDHQRRLAQLRERLFRNAKVQEGDKPAENPDTLLQEFDAVSNELLDLVTRINLTNASAQVQDMLMTQALARRDMLKQCHETYRDLAHAATITQSVSTRSEVRFLSTVDVATIQQQADAAARELRDLDAKIQEANWLIDLR